MSPQMIETKAKINKLDYIKLQFCTLKVIVNKMKLHLEKIFANIISNKGLISRIYKNSYNLKKNPPNNWINNWAEDLNRHFPKNILMANRHMKRCSTSLTIREMKIKATVRYHLTHDRMAITKRTRNSRCQQGMRKRETCTLLMGM